MGTKPLQELPLALKGHATISGAASGPGNEDEALPAQFFAMKKELFLEHHGIATDPFAGEDAQIDPVFKDYCITHARHPAWDKVFGDPAEPATSIVFGEKGAGKTALRLQIVRHLEDYNRQHPQNRVFAIEYDDFNPFLDRFRDHVGPRKSADRVLAEWKLWDHMDAILSLGVTQLVNAIVEAKPSRTSLSIGPVDPKKLDKHQARDLLLLAACYDRSTTETVKGRWHRLRRQLRYHVILAQWQWVLGLIVTGIALGITLSAQERWNWFAHPWLYLILFAAWLPWLCRAWKRFWLANAIRRNVRIGKRETNQLCQVLMNFSAAALSGQPVPSKPRTDDRYELLAKFQGILESLGFGGMIVLVDRVDEPHLINGATDQMRALIWPMLDNKFLKHPGIGIKLLLPIELAYHIEREDRDFNQRARLDKQNMIPSLDWTGEALYDLASDRVQACALPDRSPKLTELFDPVVTERRLMDAFRSLRVPRHLFKFMYRLFMTHCNSFTDEQPSWKISGECFESTLALYQREQEVADRGMRAS